MKRPHINVELQTAKYDDVRTAMKMILPKKWTLNQFVDYFSRWLDETKGTFVHTQNKIITISFTIGTLKTFSYFQNG